MHHDDWANAVRYFHGLGPAPKRGQAGLGFIAVLVILSLVTFFAVLSALI